VGEHAGELAVERGSFRLGIGQAQATLIQLDGTYEGQAVVRALGGDQAVAQCERGLFGPEGELVQPVGIGPAGGLHHAQQMIVNALDRERVTTRERSKRRLCSSWTSARPS
jgi:hypothetical protein